MKRNKIRWLILILLAGFGFLACEERAYQRAKQQGTAQAYQEFLQKYPKGKYQEDARRRLELLSFLEASQKHTILAYEEFLKRFPESRFRAQVVQALMNLLEPEIKKLTPAEMAQLRAIIKTDFGEIRLKFFPEQAPETCRNFIKLARAHFYDQSQFHLIMANYLIQGGAPLGKPEGGPGYMIKAEFNDLPHIPGAVGMARGSHPDSAGSQFYICLARIPERDGQYTVFAQVEQGLEVATEISHQPASGAEAGAGAYRSLSPILIQTIEIK